jgi:hypothetical protein
MLIKVVFIKVSKINCHVKIGVWLGNYRDMLQVR